MEPLAVDIDDAIRLYESGESIDNIARKMRVSRNTIVRRFKSAGYQTRKAGISNALNAMRRYGDLSNIVARYVAGETLQSLSRESGIDRKRLEKFIVAEGHTLRTLRQAVGLRYTRMSVHERRSLTAQAHIAVRGCKKLESSLEKRAKTHEMSLQLASRTDLILAVWLAQRNISLTPQKAIGRYNVDIAINELPVAVEVNGSWHFFKKRMSSDAERREFLFDRGWNIIEVVLADTENSPWKYLRPACADKIVTILKEFSLNKSLTRQYWVIRSDGESVS